MNKSREKSDAAKDGSSDKKIDANSIYYTHASEYPKQMHVNDLLNENHYCVQKEDMHNFLFAKKQNQFC